MWLRPGWCCAPDKTGTIFRLAGMGSEVCYSLLRMHRVKITRRRGYTRLSSKRQVTLPIRVVEEVGLLPGAQLRVEAEDGKIVLSRVETLAARRAQVIRDAAGSLTGLYGRDYLRKLRAEWR